MKRTAFLLLLLAAAFFSLPAKAQNCDPWITKAYKQLYDRGPSATECNIKNYNNGSWSSYAELVGHIAGYNRYKPGNHLKGDPWIFRAYTELYNRNPNAWELNVQNYNNGSWGSYEELKNFIQQYQNALSQNGVRVVVGSTPNGNTAAVFTDNNSKPIAANMISKNGGGVISAGGGNVISAGGGNVISAGGLNLTISQNTAGVSFGSDRTILSAGTKVIPTAGKTKLVVR
jgi:hypothetical protein